MQTELLEKFYNKYNNTITIFGIEYLEINLLKKVDYTRYQILLSEFEEEEC